MSVTSNKRTESIVETAKLNHIDVARHSAARTRTAQPFLFTNLSTDEHVSNYLSWSILLSTTHVGLMSLWLLVLHMGLRILIEE